MNEEYLRGLHGHLGVDDDYDTWVNAVKDNGEYLQGLHGHLGVDDDYDTWKNAVFGGGVTTQMGSTEDVQKEFDNLAEQEEEYNKRKQEKQQQFEDDNYTTIGDNKIFTGGMELKSDQTGLNLPGQNLEMRLASLEDNKAIVEATKAIADIRKAQYPEIFKYESEINNEEVEFDREDAAKVYENQITQIFDNDELSQDQKTEYVKHMPSMMGGDIEMTYEVDHDENANSVVGTAGSLIKGLLFGFEQKTIMNEQGEIEQVQPESDQPSMSEEEIAEHLRRGGELKENGGKPELTAKYRESVENKTRDRVESNFRDINPEDLSGGFFKDYTEEELEALDTEDKYISTLKDLNLDFKTAQSDAINTDPLVQAKIKGYAKAIEPQLEEYKKNVILKKYKLDTEASQRAANEDFFKYRESLLAPLRKNDEGLNTRVNAISQTVGSIYSDKARELGRATSDLYSTTDAMYDMASAWDSDYVPGLADLTQGSILLGEAAISSAVDIGVRTKQNLDNWYLGFTNEGVIQERDRMQKLYDKYGDRSQYGPKLKEMLDAQNKKVDGLLKEGAENYRTKFESEAWKNLAKKADWEGIPSVSDIVLGVGESLPYMVGGVAAGVASTVGAAPAAVTAIMAGSVLANATTFFGDGFSEAIEKGMKADGLDPNNPNAYMEAVLDGKYTDTALLAGSALAQASLEQLGQTKVVKGMLSGLGKATSKKSIKSALGSIYRKEFDKILPRAIDAMKVSGKAGLSEAFTEAGQEALNMIGTTASGKGWEYVRDDIDPNVILQSAKAGGIIGAFLPFAGRTTTQLGIEARATAMDLMTKWNWDGSNLVQQNKVFEKIIKGVDEKYKNKDGTFKMNPVTQKTFTEQEYQDEMDAIADTRNSGSKVPKKFSQEGKKDAIESMVKIKTLERQKQRLEPEFQGDIDKRIKEEKAKLSKINFIETEFVKAEDINKKGAKISEGLNTKFVELEDDAAIEAFMEEKGLSGGKQARGNKGSFVEDLNTGEKFILLNQKRIKDSGDYFTGAHEVLHSVLNATIAKGDENALGMARAIKDKLKTIDTSKPGKRGELAYFYKRLNAYLKDPDVTTPEAAEEAMTIMSEAMEYGIVKFDRTFTEKIKDFVQRLAATVAPGRFGKLKFETEEDVFRFLRDYNRSFKKGKLSKSIRRAAEEGIDISEDLKRRGKESSEKLEGKRKAVRDQRGTRIKGAEDSVISQLQEEGADAFEIAEEFRREVTDFVKNKYSQVPDFDIYKDIVVDEILTGPRGIVNLIDAYNAKPDEYKENVTLGSFVNFPTTGYRTRSIEIANKFFGTDFTQDISERVDIAAEEETALDTKLEEEVESLRKQLDIKEGDPLFEKVVNTVSRTFGTKLPTVESGKFITELEKQFRKFLMADVKKLMGKPSSPEYRQFLETYGEAIYNKVPQRTFNKRFAPFKKPVIDQETGKQKRMTVDQSQQAGTRVKDPKAGNLVFEKAPYNQERFIEYHLDPPTGRPASKQTALAEVIGEELGLDAAQEVLRSEDIREKRDMLMGDDVVADEMLEIASEVGRGVDFKFSKDVGSRIEEFLNDGARKGWRVAKFNLEKMKLPAGVIKAIDENPQISYLLSRAIMGFRRPLINEAELFGEEFAKQRQEYADDNFSRVNKDTHIKSLKQMATASSALMNNLDPVAVKYFGKSMFGMVDRALKDLRKGSEEDIKIYEDLEKQFNNITSKVSEADVEAFKKKNGFDPRKIEILNAGKGLMLGIQKILISDSSNKLQEIQDKFGNRIAAANANNVPALAYLQTRMLDIIADNPDNLVGILRLNESNTNNVNGPRGLSRLTSVQIIEGVSQAPVVDPVTGKYYMSLNPPGAKPEVKERLEINKKHPDYKAAVEYTNGNLDPKVLMSVLRFKGEHMEASALVNYEVTKAMIDFAKQIKNGRAYKRVSILKAFNEKAIELMVDYDQELGPKVLFDVQDKAFGTTSKLSFLRSKVINDLENNFKNPITGQNKSEFAKSKLQEKLNTKRLMASKDEASRVDQEMLKETGVLNLEEDMSMFEVLSKAKTIDEALKIARDPNAPVKKIRVFDFDDTLATTESDVLFTAPDGTEGKLNAEEFATQGKSLLDEGYVFDFSEFNKVTKGAEGPLLKIAKKIQEARGTEDVFVLTARAPESQAAIKEFLDSQGLDIPIENITGLGNSTGEAKANWIIDKAADGYNDFYFADDAYQNVKAVREALSVIDVKSKVQQAKIKAAKDLDRDFNKILEQKSGIASEKRYSEAKAKVRGANKGRFKFWIPPSAEDFTGLLYKTLGKGKLGDAQMAWYKENLFDPFARAMENLSTARVNLMNDFRKLKKDLNVPKTLAKDAVDGFTNEQAVRVYLWNKQGVAIPGLSKTDTKELVDVVESDPTLKQFADQLAQINKDPYPAPQEGWLAGTITTDLIDGLNTTKRSAFLKEWQDNADVIFSKENLNKIEAIYGPKFREALENSLQRMKSGRNKTSTGNRLSNRILNYINGSNAAIMFFNTRSAILQTISAVNFLNWGFNNPIKAGKAFANQGQYWKDFMTLMNSDFLRDRRDGLRININESEIADLAKTSKNKAKAVLSYIMEKGYLPTQYADSFAIALGGATFYRNRIIDLMENEGMTEAEAKAKAMTEFREISEESQQSSRPDKISQQQSSDIGRLILMFANTPMQYARLQKRAFQDLAAGRGSSKANVSKIIYYGVVQNIIFNALQQAMFALGFGEEDDDNDKVYNTLNGMLDSTLRGLGIGGALVSVGKNFLMDIYERSGRSRPEYTDSVWKLLQFAPPIGSKISKLRQAGWQFDSKKRRQEMFDKGFALDNPAYLAAAKVVSATTNIPLDRILLKYENLEGALDEENDWWQRIAMAGGWPKWTLEGSKNKADKPKVKTRKKRTRTRRKRTRN